MRRDRSPLAWAALAPFAALALLAPFAAARAGGDDVLVADAASRAAAEPGGAVQLDLLVNGARRGAVDVLIRDGDVLVPERQLEAAGLRRVEGRVERCPQGTCVSLGSLAPALRFEIDDVALALRLTAEPQVLGSAAFDLAAGTRPVGLRPRGDPTLFLNYSVQHSAQRLVGARTTAFAEAGASEGGRLLYTSAQLLEDGTAVRGMSSLTVDDLDRLARLVVGDAFASTTPLGGGVLLGGISVAREFSIDPYYLRAPMPRLTGFAPTPSTLDVYVNGVLTRQLAVQPGGYDIANVPLAAGAGRVETVLRDAFGRTSAVEVPYYSSPGLLARGVTDYGYALGFRRRGYGRTSFDYGAPVLVGRHRVGVGDDVTVGSRVELAPDLASGGPSATWGLPIGTLELEAAASAEEGSAGAAGSAGYGFLSARFNAGARVRLFSRRYAHAALHAHDDRAVLQSSVFAGAQLTRRVSVDVAWTLLGMRDTGRSDVVSLRTGVALGRNLVLSVTGTRTWSPRTQPVSAAFAMLSWAFAPMSMADAAVEVKERHGTTATAGVQRAVPAGTGVGYRARGGSGPQGDIASGLLQAHWDHGTVDAQYDRSGDQELGSARIAGGVVLLGERAFFTRPVQQGYALLRVGVPGVRGYAEGQEIGKTDAKGDLFVPQLIPYYGNRVGIADQDVPMEYRFGKTELLAAPMLRGAVVTRFDVAVARAAEGELVVAGLDRPPAYGELRLATADGAALSSPVGADGRFFVEDAPVGRHEAEIVWSGGRCRAALVVPPSPPIADLGRVTCEPDAAPAAPAPTPGAPAETPREGAAVPEQAPDPELVVTSRTATEGQGSPPAAAKPRERLRPTGFGPRSKRCPSCAVCLDAKLRRAIGPSALLRCVDDIAVMRALLTRTAAMNACLATTSLDEICAECQQVRAARACPTWP